MAINAVTLNGSTQYAKILYYLALASLEDFTFEGWFKQNSSGGNTYANVASMGDGTDWFFRVQTENASPSTGTNFGVQYTGTNADGYKSVDVFDLSTWVHVSIVSSHNGKSKIYKNGVEITYNLQNTPSGTIFNSTSDDFYLGCFHNLTKHFKGDIACFRLWDRARTATEIVNDKDKYLDPAEETGLVLNCNVDEASGTTIGNDAPSSNDATLSGSPSWTTGPTLTDKNYAALNQEGYRFRNDDGSETTATWIENQDTNITKPISETVRLRMLIDTTDDADSKNFRLEYKKTIDGTWDILEAAGSGIDESMVSSPSVGTIAGDASWNASGYIQITPASNGKNGYYHLDGELPADFTTEFDIYANGSADGIVFYFGTTGNTGNEETSDGGYRIYFSEYHNLCAIRFNGSIIDSVSVSDLGNGTWRTITIEKAGNEFTIYIDDTEILNHTDSSRTLGGTNYGWGGRTGGLNAEHRLKNVTLVSDVVNRLILSPSSNIVDSGANTTAQLTSPSGKTTGDFDAGRIQDDENPADGVDISADGYTELEWSMEATASASTSDIYQFRVTIGGIALNTYSVTPQWTIGAAITDKDLSDSGSGTDTINLLALLDQSDSGSGVDVINILSFLYEVDSATGTDAVSNFIYEEISDTGSGIEVIGLFVEFALGETGSGTESVGVFTSGDDKSIAETGSGSDSLDLLNQADISDVSSGSETLGLLIMAQISETSFGIDFVQLLAQPFITDSGMALDIINTLAYIDESDTFSFNDELEILNNATIIDSGSSTDFVGLFQDLEIEDTGTALDFISLINQLSLSELGVGSEELDAVAFADVNDAGSVVENLDILTFIALPEDGSGIDSVIAIETGRINNTKTILFTKHRSTSLKQKTSSVILKQRRR